MHLYGHPRLVAAIKQQLDELPFAPRRFTNEPAVALADIAEAGFFGKMMDSVLMMLE